ncbi:MAG: tRNA (adenosine(37)-N6)-threonylcarbamoyltransferase complex ATPase subunit type 1 TsaE [Bacteroidota bacterium]|nr:tRNA (adenosine(37)-N6)-threonylcarbamoyltransferase complex ATPase subunit type 1 TsaE [Bacteroidota bacterium]
MSAHVFRSRSVEETHAFARALANRLDARSVVALCGELGSGKTVVVRGICDAFGCADQVTSPTFTLVHEYQGTRRIVHCDLYRLSSMEEMIETGMVEAFREDAIVLVEWAERALDLLPRPFLRIACEHGSGENERIFTVETVEPDGAVAPFPLIVRQVLREDPP